MRILYLHPKAWTGEHAILSELVRMGHEVCVLEERRPGPKRQFAEWHRQPGDRIRTLWYDPSRGLLRLVTWLADRVFRRAFDGRNLVHRMLVVAEAARHFQPDAIVASDGFSYAIPAGFAKRLGLLSQCLLVTYIGGDILDCPEAEYGHRRTPMTDWIIRYSLVGVDVLRPVSPMLRTVLLEEGAASEKIHVLPSHLVADRPALAAVLAGRDGHRKGIRERYGLKPDAPLVVTLSMNQRGKGLYVLAQAWPQIVKAVPGACWLLCGPEHPSLASDVWPVLDQAGVRNSIVATGRLDGLDVFHHLCAGDLHVNPSLCEGLNMAVVEAAAVGTPTIGSDGAGVSYWISRFDAGKVVPRGQAAALADAIIFALSNPERLRAWTLALPALAEEFALERIAVGLTDLLQGGLEQPHPISRARS